MNRPSIEYLRTLLKPSKEQFHCSNCRQEDEQERERSFMWHAEELLDYIDFLEVQQRSVGIDIKFQEGYTEQV